MYVLRWMTTYVRTHIVIIIVIIPRFKRDVSLSSSPFFQFFLSLLFLFLAGRGGVYIANLSICMKRKLN